jgi:CHAT domain-containing protein
LPVHAAGIYAGAERDFCSQYVVSSYTPTLAALLRAQSGHRAFTKDQIKLMAIASSHVEGMPQLPSVEKELKDIMGVFRKAGVHVGPPAGQTDITSSVRNSISVMKRLESANIVHLACHGIQNVANPFASRFRLGPINLDVERLMRLNIKQPFFAFLSACETAKGDQKHADEIVHLAATMLFSGFKSVVATMW